MDSITAVSHGPGGSAIPFHMIFDAIVMGMGAMGRPAGSGSTLATLRYGGAVKPLALPMALIPVPEMPAPERTRRFVMGHAMGGMGSHGMGMGFW